MLETTAAVVVCMDTTRSGHRVRDLQVGPGWTAVVVTSPVLPGNNKRHNGRNDGYSTDGGTDTNAGLGTGRKTR